MHRRASAQPNLVAFLRLAADPHQLTQEVRGSELSATGSTLAVTLRFPRVILISAAHSGFERNKPGLFAPCSAPLRRNLCCLFMDNSRQRMCAFSESIPTASCSLRRRRSWESSTSGSIRRTRLATPMGFISTRTTFTSTSHFARARPEACVGCSTARNP